MALAGCSGGSAKGTTDETADKGLEVVGQTLKYDPNTLVNDGKPIKLEWWLWFDEDRWQELADQYTEIHPNVTFNIVSHPWGDYGTKLPLALQGSSGPTLFNIHNSFEANFLPFMEPYDIPVDELEADYSTAYTHVIDGKIYYTDFGIMSGAIYYNTDMWTEAGLTDSDIPETWEDFREVAKELTIRDGDKLTQAGFNINNLGQNMQLGMPYQQGQNLFAPDGTTPTVDTEAGLDFINSMLAIYEDGSASPDFGTDSAESFGQGQSAMVYSWGHFVGTLQRDFPDLNWDTFQTPIPVAGEVPYAYDRYNGEATFGINKAGSDAEKEVAQDFLRFFLTNESFQTDLCDSYGVFPAYTAIADAEVLKTNPALTAFGDIERYIWPGAFPAVFDTELSNMWQDILYNGVSPESALASAQEALVKGLAGSGFKSVENLYAFYEPTE